MLVRLIDAFCDVEFFLDVDKKIEILSNPYFKILFLLLVWRCSRCCCAF